MAFDHEKLDVYRLGLEFLVLAERVIHALPKGRSHLADQLTRASLSIVLNVAEGAGKFSRGDKRRYYLAARGSATESAALLDVYFRLSLAEEMDHRDGKRTHRGDAREAGSQFRGGMKSSSVTLLGQGLGCPERICTQ